MRWIRCWSHALAGLAAAAMLSGCTTNPATGRSQLNLISPAQAAAMGEEAKPQLIQEYGGEVQSQALRNYVRGVGQKLVQHVEPEFKDIDWEFITLDSEEINAFALPGGKVFMTRGLLERLNNEAQVAGVLGHEIGHVTAQHVNERVSHAMVVAGIGELAEASVSGSESAFAQLIPLVIGLGGQGYLLKFSRGQEADSDDLGLRYMVRAGYDPIGMLQVLQVLAEASQTRQPEFLSTHPHPETRLVVVQEHLRGPYAYTQNNPEYGLHADRFQREAAPHLR